MFNQPIAGSSPVPNMPPVAGNGKIPSAAPSVAPSGASKLAKQANSSLIKTVAIVLLTLLLVGAILLAVYLNNEYQLAKSDVESQVAVALTAREKEITDKLEAEFAEREKTPYSTLTGPDDYGTVSLKYPKTWSAYIAKDAVSGGEYEAYLHPGEVPPVSGGSKTPFAFHISIKSETFEAADNRYKSSVTSGKLTPSVINIGSATANRYDGQLPNQLVGSVVIFKIRDKVVTVETNAEIYREDFNNIINSITFNE